MLSIEATAAAARPSCTAVAAAPAAAAAAPAASGGAAAAGSERRPESFVRVLHLNPAVYFANVLEEAHAVVLAGGTMQ